MWDDSSEGLKSHAEALAAFPFEHLEVSGRDALREWERLKAAGRGTPVVIGDGEAFTRVVEPFHPDWWSNAEEPILQEVLARADRLRHPQDLVAFRHAEEESADRSIRAYCEDHPEDCGKDSATVQDDKTGVRVRLITPGSFAGENDEDPEPPLGEWPASPPPPDSSLVLTVAQDWQTGRPYDKVHIILVPTDDPTTIPAYLRWGGWNENPSAEYHVAALRSWGQRYGAELVGLGPDTMNIRVALRPEIREEAIALAREQYALCFDIILQGYEWFSNLGAALTSNDWWVLWWD